MPRKKGRFLGLKRVKAIFKRKDRALVHPDSKTVDSFVASHPIYGEWNFYHEKRIVKAYPSAIIRATPGTYTNAITQWHRPERAILSGLGRSIEKKRSVTVEIAQYVVPNRFTALRCIAERPNIRVAATRTLHSCDGLEKNINRSGDWR